MMPATDMRRLRSLILLLSSPADGEVTAAARGIARLLNRHDLSLHDLANSIAPGAARAENSGNGSNHSANWHDIAVWLATRSDDLTDKQQDFVRNMAARNPNGRPPSPAQMNWLNGLAEQVEGRTAAAA